MKIFVIKFKNIHTYEGFFEGKNISDAIKWFAENSPAKARIISIREGSSKGLTNIKNIF